MQGGNSSEGKGKTFHDAAQNAADKAKGKHGPGTFKVVDIQVVVENPIRDYIVTLGPPV